MTILTFPQGTTRTIWIRGVVDDNHAPLDLTGWSVRATATGPGTPSSTVAVWSTTPTGSQGRAVASMGTIALEIPSVMSASWTSHYAILDISLTEPGVGGRDERFDPVGLIVEP